MEQYLGHGWYVLRLDLADDDKQAAVLGKGKQECLSISISLYLEDTGSLNPKLKMS